MRAENSFAGAVDLVTHDSAREAYTLALSCSSSQRIQIMLGSFEKYRLLGPAPRCARSGMGSASVYFESSATDLFIQPWLLTAALSRNKIVIENTMQMVVGPGAREP